MSKKTMHKYLRLLPCLFFILSIAAAGTAEAVDLCAGELVVTMADGQQLKIWGLGYDKPTGCDIKVEGPTIRVPADSTTLNINLKNNLSEPVSLHILGQNRETYQSPVWEGGRVRSFTNETPAGGTGIYRWGSVANPLKPGTYILLSGTNPAKQVQMGLMGTVIKDAVASAPGPPPTPAQAYTGIPYDKEIILVFQDYDPAMHAAVTADPPTYTSSAYRKPKYFQINGDSYPEFNDRPLDRGLSILAGERVLLRFVNAGGITHVPQILNSYLTVVGEDGIPLKYSKEVYGFELNPAKTVDAIWTPTVSGRFPILDGALKLSNSGASPGGMLAYLSAGADTVAITNVVYSSASTQLLVQATTTLAGAILGAQGYGNLLLDPPGQTAPPYTYRRVFGNVSASPSSVTVVSSGGGSATFNLPAPPAADTVNITKVSYSARKSQLLVEATSSNQPGATLNANGLGNLLWNPIRLVYQRVFSVSAKPADVTVNSSGGGSATIAVP